MLCHRISPLSELVESLKETLIFRGRNSMVLVRCIRRNHQNARIHMSTEHNANQKLQRQDRARHISTCYARGEKSILYTHKKDHKKVSNIYVYIYIYIYYVYIYIYYVCMWMYVADQPDIADIDRSTYRSPSSGLLRPSGSSGIFQRRNCHRLATTRAHKAWYVPGWPQNMILNRHQG